MQLRTIALVLSIVGLFYSGFVSALGLGEITLKSQFNQPLNAEIRLLKVRDLSKDEIFSALASRDDFKRAGVDRLFLLSSLKFEVVLDNPAKPFIRVTSSKPIVEPYLNFLVEVQWPSGRLLREYTLLLDLPVFNDSGANAPVAAPSSSVAAPTPAAPRPQVREPQPQVVPPPTKPSRTAAPTRAADNNVVRQTSPRTDSYKVKSGDTLWEIAESTLADSPASINQRMIAIQQANPEAFANGNINHLRNGRVLRIPSAQEVADISSQQASNAVREQNKTWSAKAKPAQKAVLTSAAPSTQSTSSTGQPEGRLTLGSADSAQSSKGSGTSGSGESLQNELAIAKDELARATRQNDELRSRITELESQIETMDNLVSVTSDQLKALQAAAENGEGIPTDSTPVDNTPIDGSGDDASVDEANTSSESIIDATAGTDEQAGSDDAIDQPVAAATDPEPAVEAPAPVEANPFQAPEPTVVASPAKPSLVETVIAFLKENMLIVGGAVLGFLALLLVLLRLRNKPEDDIDDFDLDDEDDNLFNLDDDNLEALDELDDDIEEQNDLSIDEDLDDTVQAQTEDVVAEADIYVSLGQEDKAIELLQKEIQQNPDNADARLGLLKIYAKSQNSAGFDEQYAQLLPLGNVYANDQAMALRKEIENAEPFDTDQYSLKDDDGLDFLQEAEESDLDIDLDLDLDTPEESADDGSMAFTETDSDINLDDISLDLGDLGDDTLELDDEDSSSEDLDTDFSLDLDDSKSDTRDEALAASAEVDDSDHLEDIEFSLDLDEESDFNADDLSLDLDNELDDLPTQDTVEKNDDEALEEIEFDLDLDMDDELSESVDDLEDSLPLDDEELVVAENDLSDISTDEGLENDFSVELDGDLNDIDLDNDELDLSMSLDEEVAGESIDMDLDTDLSLDDIDGDTETSEDSLDWDADLSLDGMGSDTETSDGDLDLDTDLSLDDTEIEEADDSFDLDSPPPMDIDMASLDQEIDAMTADMDDTVSDNDVASDADAADSLGAPEAAVEPTESLDTFDLDDGNLDEDKTLNVEEEQLDLDDELELETEEVVESPAQPSSLDINDAREDTTISQDDDLDFLEESDEVSTKLDLAKAYMDMGDREGAEDILNEVMEEGSEQQKADAKALMEQL